MLPALAMLPVELPVPLTGGAPDEGILLRTLSPACSTSLLSAGSVGKRVFLGTPALAACLSASLSTTSRACRGALAGGE